MRLLGRLELNLGTLLRLSPALVLLLVFQPVEAAGAGGESDPSPATPVIYFATTRLNEGTPQSPDFGFKRNLTGDSLTFGAYSLRRPRLDKLSSARTGSDYKLLLKGNHIAWKESRALACELLSRKQFFDLVSSWHGPVFVYLHGYDKKFAESIRDAAMVAAEFEQRQGVPALAIVFSWPSIAARTEYSADQANMEWSEPAFKSLMDGLLAAKPEQSPLDVVAHSMGNRLVLWYLTRRLPGHERLIRNVFMCSADVDYHLALNQVGDIQKQIFNNLYVLVSDKDGPLIMSQYLHGQPRLGRPIDPPRLTRQRYELASQDYWLQLAGDALDLLSGNGFNDPKEVRQWLDENPSIESDLGERAFFIDVTEVMDEDLHHALAWPVVAGLMLERPAIDPLGLDLVHKRPDRESLSQSGGKPPILYKFYKVMPRAIQPPAR